MIDLINFYRVRDLKVTRDFYENVLGFELYKDQGKCLIFDTMFGKLGFCSHFPEEESKSSCITFVFSSKQEVDEIFKKIENQCTSKPELNEYFQIYHFFINDPNGLKLEFQHFLE